MVRSFESNDIFDMNPLTVQLRSVCSVPNDWGRRILQLGVSLSKRSLGVIKRSHFYCAFKDLGMDNKANNLQSCAQLD